MRRNGDSGPTSSGTVRLRSFTNCHSPIADDNSGEPGSFEQDIRNLLYSLTDVAVAACDRNLKILGFSPAYQVIVNDHIPADVVELGELVKLFTEDGSRALPLEERPLVRATRGEVVRDLVALAQRPDGTQRYLRFNASPRRDGDGAIIGAISLVQDVTKEHLRGLREDQLHTQLIRTINHEFRTPLSLVLGNAELLADMRLDLPLDAQQLVDSLVDGAQRLHALTRAVSEMVDLHDVQDLHLSTGDLLVSLRREARAVATLAAAHGVTVRAIVPDVVQMNGDHAAVRRAVGALLRNACAHAPAGSTVRLSVTQADELITVTVCDEGPGISPEDVPRLCRPFQTGRANEGEGRGLGLALASTVAEAHGGHLILRPNEPQGLCAALLLPVTASVLEAPVRPAGAVPSG